MTPQSLVFEQEKRRKETGGRKHWWKRKEAERTTARGRWACRSRAANHHTTARQKRAHIHTQRSKRKLNLRVEAFMLVAKTLLLLLLLLMRLDSRVHTLLKIHTSEKKFVVEKSVTLHSPNHKASVSESTEQLCLRVDGEE